MNKKIHRDDGTLECCIPFVDGVAHGVAEYYYEDGVTVHFCTPFVNGVMNGNQLIYSRKGVIIGYVPYVNGKEHGLGMAETFLDDESMLFTYYVDGEMIKFWYDKRISLENFRNINLY